jgi:hypothetical protein
MKNQLTQRASNFETVIQNMKAEHSKEIESLRLEHSKEMQKVSEDIMKESGQASNVLREQWTSEMNALRTYQRSTNYKWLTNIDILPIRSSN